MAEHVYIITGASSGLGAALSRQLMAEGNKVFGISRTVNKDIQQLAHDACFHFTFVAGDLSQVESIDSLLQGILTSLDTSNLETITLINNAATVSPIKNIQACSQAEIATSIQLNLAAPIMLTSCLVRETAQWTAKRTIVNISSGSGQYPASSMSLYCSTKAALNMFTKCVELEQGAEPNPVRMFSIDPGMMDTGMQQLARESDFELSTYFTHQKNTGNLAEPADVARNILLEIR